MYKTIWNIYDETENVHVQFKFTYYHFGKTPKFPTWYCEEGHTYIIEMVWNLRLIPTLKMFCKCLLKKYTLEREYKNVYSKN